MTPTISMRLKPWVSPNFAVIEMPPRPKQDGMIALPSIPVADLSIEVLDALAYQWLVDLYTKAGQPMMSVASRGATP